MKIVRAIRNGWIKPKKDDKADKPRYYLIWDKEDEQVTLYILYIALVRSVTWLYKQCTSALHLTGNFPFFHFVE